jgi:hypothetical protein
MPPYNERNVVLEDVRIIFRNFAGKEGMYNAKGKRTFSVLLDDARANAMTQDGWNVKWLKPREEGDEPQAHLSVTVNYNGRPPRVVMITSRGRTTLHEDEVELLDWVDIRNVDLIIRPFNWEVNGKTGISAYLQSMFITIEEDELERKYAEYEEVSAQGVRNE